MTDKTLSLKLFTAKNMSDSYERGKADGRQQLLKEIRQLIGVPEPPAKEPGLDDLNLRDPRILDLNNLDAPLPPRRRRRVNVPTGPRRGYKLAVASKIDLHELTGSQEKVVRHLAGQPNGQSTFPQLMAATKLSRSTIANSLTKLFRADLVRSEQLG